MTQYFSVTPCDMTSKPASVNSVSFPSQSLDVAFEQSCDVVGVSDCQPSARYESQTALPVASLALHKIAVPSHSPLPTSKSPPSATPHPATLAALPATPSCPTASPEHIVATAVNSVLAVSKNQLLMPLKDVVVGQSLIQSLQGVNLLLL